MLSRADSYPVAITIVSKRESGLERVERARSLWEEKKENLFFFNLPIHNNSRALCTLVSNLLSPKTLKYRLGREGAENNVFSKRIKCGCGTSFLLKTKPRYYGRLLKKALNVINCSADIYRMRLLVVGENAGER